MSISHGASKDERSSVDQSAKVYRYASIRDSIISRNCVIGDFSRVTSSKMKPYSRVDRFSLLYHSTMENYSYLGAYCMIMHTPIGKFSSIAWGVTIGPGEHDYTRVTMHDFLYNRHNQLMPDDCDAPYNRFEEKSVIGNDVWIGANVTILRGVEIGDGAVIGANSTVTDDIPPYAIAVGSPAKIVNYRFSKDIISRYLDLKWWDFPSEVIRENYDIFSSKKISESMVKLEQIKKEL